MRRERTDPVDELACGLCEVELTVSRGDLLGVHDALLWLRLELRFGDDAVQQPCGDLRRAVVDGAGIVVRGDVERLLRCDWPRIELRRRAMDRDAGARIAGHQRAFDRSGPAPARQEGRVHVQPERAREERLRDQQAVGGNDDRVGGNRDAFVEPRRLLHGNAMSLRDLFRTCRLEPAAAAARLVWAREEQCNVVVRYEPLEHVGAERRGGRDGDASH